MSTLGIGCRVIVRPVSPRGVNREKFAGTIAGRRDNAKGLGSVEYLVVRDGSPSGRYYPAAFCTVIHEGGRDE